MSERIAFKRSTISVAMDDGSTATCEALVRGGLAIHRYDLSPLNLDDPNDLWAITHIASGRRVSALTPWNYRAAARAVRVLLDSGIDWTVDADGLKAQLSHVARQPLMKAARLAMEVR